MFKSLNFGDFSFLCPTSGYHETEVGKVFMGVEYPIPTQMQDSPSLNIVDIGANIGSFTAYSKLCFPQAKVSAFEPLPKAFQVLEANCKSFKNVHLFNFGLGNRKRQEKLYSVDASGTDARSSIHVGTDNETLVEVQDVKDVLSRDKIDILKIDTEGCEIEILGSIVGMGIPISILFLEWHSESDRRDLDRIIPPELMLTHMICAQPGLGTSTYVTEKLLVDWKLKANRV